MRAPKFPTTTFDVLFSSFIFWYQLFNVDLATTARFSCLNNQSRSQSPPFVPSASSDGLRNTNLSKNATQSMLTAVEEGFFPLSSGSYAAAMAAAIDLDVKRTPASGDAARSSFS